jgi:hypothetical protein
MKKYFILLLIICPALAFSGSPEITQKYLVGEWDIVGIKQGGEGDFQSPLQSAKWEFTEDGKFKEMLGENGAQIHWNYEVENDEIRTSFGGMAFSWKILEQMENVMVVKHHLGVFKVERK